MKTKSYELQYFEALQRHSHLDKKERQHLLRLQSGYEGELKFETILSRLIPTNWRVHPNIWFRFSNYLEVDILLNCGSHLFILDVKNYADDFTIAGDHLVRSDGYHIPDIFFKLKRDTNQIETSLINSKIDCQLLSYLVFINDDCYVRGQNNLGIDYFLRNQLSFMVRKMKEMADENERRIEIVESWITKNAIKQPVFLEIKHKSDFNRMVPGLVCPNCHKKIVSVGRQTVLCPCGQQLTKREVVDMNIRDYQLLFPGKINMNDLQRFLKESVSQSYLYARVKANI